MSVRAKCVVAAAALLLALPCGSDAQNNTVTPSVTLDFRYDSNARFKDAETSGGNSDFITSATPRIEFIRDRAGYGVRAYYGLTANHHTRNTELNNTSHSAGADLQADLTKRWRLRAGDRFAYTNDSLQAVGFGEGVLVTRTNMLANTAYADISRQATKNTDAALTLRDHVLKFDDPALFDSRTGSAALTGRHKYSRYGTARLSYTYTDFSFDSDGKTGFETHAVEAGFEEAVSPSVNLDLGGGIEYADGLPGGSGLFVTANAGIEKSLKDSVMKLSFERDVSTPTGLTDEINVRDALIFIWDFTVRKNIFTSVYTGVARHRTEPEKRVYINSYIAEVSGNWQPYRWLLVGAGASHYQQWPGDDLGTGLTRNRVFVNMTFIGEEWRF